jgi:hypothetical protein
MSKTEADILYENREEIYNSMGKELKIPMWNNLSKDEQYNILHNNDRDSAACDYYVCVPVS